MCFRMLLVAGMNTHVWELTVLKNTSLAEYGFQHHTLKKRCVCVGLGGCGQKQLQQY